MWASLFWIVLVGLCVVGEMHTNAFVSLFIGIGAAFGFVASLTPAPFPVQALIWVATSVLGVLWLRPYAMRKFPRREYELDLTQPSYSALTNQTGVVEVAVGDETSPGRVKIQGETWRAVTDWPEPIAVGTRVTVFKSLGTTLWVNPS